MAPSHSLFIQICQQVCWSRLPNYTADMATFPVQAVITTHRGSAHSSSALPASTQFNSTMSLRHLPAKASPVASHLRVKARVPKMGCHALCHLPLPPHYLSNICSRPAFLCHTDLLVLSMQERYTSASGPLNLLLPLLGRFFL